MSKYNEVFCMKFSVGLQKTNFNFVKSIIDNRQHIYEVYFSWGDFPNGRGSRAHDDEYTSWELGDMQREMLSMLAEEKISLNLLFNANCYGAFSQSRDFFHKSPPYYYFTLSYLTNSYSKSK